MRPIRLPLIPAALSARGSCVAQQQVCSIIATGSPFMPFAYMGVTGARLAGSAGSLQSSWDRTGSNFAVKYQPGANCTSLTQFIDTGHPDPFLTPGVREVVKVRTRSRLM